MKKNSICFFGFVMLIGLIFPTTVSAAEYGDSVCTKNLAEYAEDGSLSEVQEDYEKIVFLDMLQEEGDMQVLGTWDGEVYCVEVVDVTQYGLKDGVETKTFLYTKTNVLGVKTNLMSVTATLTWIKNDKVTSFECSHIIYNSLVEASWEPGYIEQNDIIWMRALNVKWDNGYKETIFFSGRYYSYDGKESISINSSTDSY